MAAHLYWRINVSANDGSINFLAIAEVEMRASVGGADQCTGGTATASSNDATTPPANAFDNSNSTVWSTPNLTLSGWLRYQFASAVDVAEYTIRSHPTSGGQNRSPKDFTLEWSDNGTSWTVADTRANVTGWTYGETKTFVVGAITSARLFQSVAETVRGNPAGTAQLSQAAAEVLRASPGGQAQLQQVVVEVLRSTTPNLASAQFDQSVIEAVSTNPHARLDQAVVEVATPYRANARLDQAVLEVASPSAYARINQSVVEVASPVAYARQDHAVMEVLVKDRRMAGTLVMAMDGAANLTKGTALAGQVVASVAGSADLGGGIQLVAAGTIAGTLTGVLAAVVPLHGSIGAGIAGSANLSFAEGLRAAGTIDGRLLGRLAGTVAGSSGFFIMF